MFDKKLLDGRSFDELRDGLDYVLQRIDKIEEETSDGEDDPRLDPLYTLADLIIRRMDSIVRESNNVSPAHLAEWEKNKRDYEASYDKYTDSILEDDLLIDPESGEDS